jgi:hypothetical protein
MTKEKMKAPPLYIPERITRVFVSNADVFQLLASAEQSENAVGTAYRTFVWADGECEVEEISGIWEVGLHGRWEVEFCQIWNMYAPKFPSAGDGKRM